MNDQNVVPLWTLPTTESAVPDVFDGQSMTADRLSELRTVLAAMASFPIATLEAHPVSADLDRSHGMSLDSASPLALHLSQLVGQAGRACGSAAASKGGGVLYRMVVPAKFASQVGGGLLSPMAAKGAASGVHSALVGSSRIAGQASFVPVGAKLAGGAGAFAVAAPLVMMAVAAGVSLNAEHKRRQALDEIRALLKKLNNDALKAERIDLASCRDPITKATAILLDRGEIGQTVEVATASAKVNTAIARAEEHLKEWQSALAKLADKPVEVAKLKKEFPGIDEEGGEFYTRLALAEAAIALKKRIIVLQAVEHAQKDPANPFKSFVRVLRDDQERVIKLASELAELKRGLARLRLDRSHGVMDFTFTMGEVDQLLRTTYLMRELGEGVDLSGRQSDIAIEIVRNPDDSIVVFPAALIS
jgi:hypothetical protein